VLQGRLEGQAPDIDATVLLSDCDATEIMPGTIISATITGADDYDLIARPN